MTTFGEGGGCIGVGDNAGSVGIGVRATGAPRNSSGLVIGIGSRVVGAQAQSKARATETTAAEHR